MINHQENEPTIKSVVPSIPMEMDMNTTAISSLLEVTTKQVIVNSITNGRFPGSTVVFDYSIGSGNFILPQSVHYEVLIEAKASPTTIPDELSNLKIDGCAMGLFSQYQSTVNKTQLMNLLQSDVYCNVMMMLTMSPSQMKCYPYLGLGVEDITTFSLSGANKDVVPTSDFANLFISTVEISNQSSGATHALLESQYNINYTNSEDLEVNKGGSKIGRITLDKIWTHEQMISNATAKYTPFMIKGLKVVNIQRKYIKILIAPWMDALYSQFLNIEQKALCGNIIVSNHVEMQLNQHFLVNCNTWHVDATNTYSRDYEVHSIKLNFETMTPVSTRIANYIQKSAVESSVSIRLCNIYQQFQSYAPNTSNILMNVNRNFESLRYIICKFGTLEFQKYGNIRKQSCVSNCIVQASLKIESEIFPSNGSLNANMGNSYPTSTSDADSSNYSYIRKIQSLFNNQSIHKELIINPINATINKSCNHETKGCSAWVWRFDNTTSDFDICSKRVVTNPFQIEFLSQEPCKGIVGNGCEFGMWMFAIYDIELVVSNNGTIIKELSLMD